MSTRSDRPPLANAVLLAIAPVTAGVAILSPSPLPAIASGLCLALVIWLLWRNDDPPILLLPALYQWSEVAILPISTAWQGVPLNELAEHNVALDGAAYFGLAGVAALAAGMRIGAGRARGQPFVRRLEIEAKAWRFRDVAIICFAAMMLGYAAAVISAFVGPWRELLSQLSYVKYAGLFVLAYWCLLRGDRYAVLAGVMAFEIVFGMTGFFAEFKNSVLTLVVAALAARPRLRGGDIAVVSLAVAVLLSAAIFWSAVKTEYRTFVNRGTGDQVVLVPIDDRLRFLAGEARSMSGERFVDGFDRLIARHGYIEYLALTMRNVPQRIPHEDGRLTLAMLAHISVPRFIYPDKPALPSDTTVTAKYTGLSFAGSGDTSISIGHLGELYIDFGLYGALLVMAVSGACVGFAYWLLRDDRRSPALVAAGLCLIVALPVGSFGTAYAKVVGSFVSLAVIAFVLQRLVLPVAFPLLLKTTAERAAQARTAPTHG